MPALFWRWDSFWTQSFAHVARGMIKLATLKAIKLILSQFSIDIIAIEQIRELLEVPFPEEKNLAEILLCIGFFLIFFIEEIVHCACHKKARSATNPETGKILPAHWCTFKTLITGHSKTGKTCILFAALLDGYPDSTGSRRKSSIRDFLTVVALSFHAVFEGMAVGLEDSIPSVWTLFTGQSLTMG